jgi:hypothetical protein
MSRAGTLSSESEAVMGEYANFNGESVKIGTCESMYYLRFDQRALVQKQAHSLDPVECVDELRFRFPWPDEDDCTPGDVRFSENGFERSVAVPGFVADADVEHSTVQFASTRPTGYVVSLPCPESSAYGDAERGGRLAPFGGLHVHRNGFSGAVLLTATRYRPGIGLVPVLKCGGCGSMWRVEDVAGIERIAVAFRSAADALRDEKDGRRAYWHGLADRVLAGIGVVA